MLKITENGEHCDVPFGAGEVFCLPPLFETIYQDSTARTCKSCGDFHPGKTPPAGWT